MASTQWTIYIIFASILVILLCIGGMLKFQEKFNEDEIPILYMDHETRRSLNNKDDVPMFNPIIPYDEETEDETYPTVNYPMDDYPIITDEVYGKELDSISPDDQAYISLTD